MLHHMGVIEKPRIQADGEGGGAPAGSSAASSGKRKRQMPTSCHAGQNTVELGGCRKVGSARGRGCSAGQAWVLVDAGKPLLTEAASSAKKDRAAAPPFGKEPMAHMKAYKTWLESLPGSWQLGEYAKGHLCRKHCYVEANRVSPRASDGLAWMPQLTLDDVVSISPDRSAFLSQVPPHLKKTGRLAAQMGCHQLLVPMWACLVKDALAQHAGLAGEAGRKSLLESVQTEGPAWKAAAEKYREQFGIAPCLAELVKVRFQEQATNQP